MHATLISAGMPNKSLLSAETQGGCSQALLFSTMLPLHVTGVVDVGTAGSPTRNRDTGSGYSYMTYFGVTMYIPGTSRASPPSLGSNNSLDTPMLSSNSPHTRQIWCCNYLSLRSRYTLTVAQATCDLGHVVLVNRTPTRRAESFWQCNATIYSCYSLLVLCCCTVSSTVH